MSAEGPSVNFKAVLGPVILGQVAQILLYGILVVVFFRFLTSSAWSRAKWHLRLVSIFVVGLATASTGLGINDIWFYATAITADINVILGGTAAQGYEPVLLGVIAFTVQVVLVLRVVKVIPQKYFRWVFIFVMISCALIGLYGAIAMTAWSIAYHFDPLVDYKHDLGLTWAGIFKIWLWTTAAVDVVITLIYVFALCKRLGGGTETTNNVLRVVVGSAARTAAYTSILQVVSAILTQVYGLDDPNTYLICYAFWEPLPAIYALSLFTTLGVADNVVTRLGDPNLRATNGTNLDKSFDASRSNGLPQFYVSDVGQPESTGERPRSVRSAMSRANGRGEGGGEGERMFRDEDLERGLGVGQMHGRSTTSLVPPEAGVRVEVEKVEQVDDEKEQRRGAGMSSV
ncbi:hypothetical protein JCM8547_000979 [Rhodosporidiobolus lusitaniae]